MPHPHFAAAGTPEQPAAKTATAGGKFAYADVLRTLAALAVVMIHISGQGVVHTELVSDFSHWVAIFWDAASRWSVPVFVMVSGALLLDPSKNETLGEFYRKRVSRIGIPLVFWSVAYLLWRRYYVPEPDLTFPKMARQIFYGIPSFHFYFLFLVMGLYLFTPLFRVFVRHATVTERWTMALCALLLTALSQQLRIMIGGWVQFTAFDYFVPYVGFFLAGHAIAHTRIPESWNRFSRLLAWILFPASVLVSTVGVGIAQNPQELNSAIESFYQYTYPTTMIMSLSFFIIVFSLYQHPGPLRRRIASVCAWIGPAAFGIYIIHPILLWEIFKRHGMPVYPNTLISCPAWTLALFVACLLITKVIQLVPGIRRIVG